MTPRHELGAWMKLYPQDWLAGTRGLNLAMRGAYIDLLCHAWEHGSIPADSEELADFLGIGVTTFESIWKRLRSKWEPHPDDPGRLVNARQEAVRAEQAGRVAGGVERWNGSTPEHRSEHARLAARARWDARSCSNASSMQADMQAPSKLDARDSGLRTQELVPDGTSTQPRDSARPARAARRDGKTELRAALDSLEAAAAAPLRSDLIAAAEAYRERRVKRRGSVWDRDQWLELMRPWASDPLPLVEALRQATQAGWLSVHPRGNIGNPRPTAAQERERRSREATARFLSRFGSKPSQEAPSES